MINVSEIKSYIYCPMKLYLKEYLDEDANTDYLLHNELKNLKIDIQDIIQKNMRKLKQEYNLEKIEEILSQEIKPYIEKNINNLKTEYELSDEIVKKYQYEMINEANFNIKIFALKVEKAMKSLEINGPHIVEMFFPNSLYTYLIRDPQLELIGVCDKIEIINGNYYPVIMKNTKPPMKGVWDGDAIELVAQSILIEEEFDTEVFVGFVDYLKIGERRPVVMDVGMRKSLFKSINEVNEIKNNKKTPRINKQKSKCKNCEYEAICLNQ